MVRNGLLIDYEYCTGCHTCEVACKQEHGFPAGKGGIRVSEIITENPSGKHRIDNLPFITEHCDLCAARTKRGESPACVKHCQAWCLYYGRLAELAGIMENKPRAVLYSH
jgi:Fe-S-cluster-containing dehydrogenase component